MMSGGAGTSGGSLLRLMVHTLALTR